MNGIEYLIPAAIDWHDLSARWLLTLAHFLWEGALIGLVAFAALVFARRSSSHVRHGICAAALVCLIPCLAVTFAYIEPGPAGTSRPVAAAEKITEPNEPRVVEIPPVVADLPRLPIPPEVEGQERAAPGSPPVATAADAPVNTVPYPTAPAEPTLLVRYAPWIVAAYAAVVIALLLRTGIGVWGGKRLRAAAGRVQDAGLLAALTRQAELIGLAAAPAVGWCRRVSVPTVVGIIKPIILLPATFATGLDSDQLAAILSHELAHIRRHDLLINLLQRVVESLLFFHPVVWWISRRVSIEREHCCDDVASATGFGNVQYAGALLRMAELSAGARGRRFAGQVAALSADGAHPSELSRRIERLLGMHSAPRLGASRLLAAATACVIVLGAATVGVLAQIAGDDGGQADPAKNTTTENETPGDADAPVNESPPRKGLEFLKPYPKLHGLSLEMTEKQFLAIARRKKLALRNVPGDHEYSIETGDGYRVIVEFGNKGGKCRGIQRIRGKSKNEGTISGKIVLDDGSPATVKGWMYYESKNGSTSASGTVDQFVDRFDVSPPAGTVWLSYYAEGYAPAWVGPFNLQPGTAVEDVRIVLTPGHTARVRVVSDKGTPVAGAKLIPHPEINGKTDGPNREERTDAEGECILKHLAETNYAIQVSAPGYETLRTSPIPIEPDELLSLTMTPSEPSSGIILNADGTPAAGAKLRAKYEYRADGSGVSFANSGDGFWGKVVATTDRDGRFTLDQLARGSHYLFAIESSDGARAIVHDLKAGQRNVRIKMPPRRDLVVEVAGALNDLPTRKGKPYIRVRQRIQFEPLPGQRIGELVGGSAPIELTKDGGKAVFRGLAVDLKPNADRQQVEVRLGSQRDTMQTVELATDGDTQAEFVLGEQQTEAAPGPPKGLEFLKPYPKLHGLSLEMTEEQFLAIVKRMKILLQKNPGDTSYSIPTGDGFTVIVMFGNGGQCSGIQRLRGNTMAVSDDGIHWSTTASDGIRCGARLLAPNGRLKSGDPLVIQYYLRNETETSKSLDLGPSKPAFPTLSEGHLIDLSLFPSNVRPQKVTIDAGQVLSRPEDRVEIATTGLPAGPYFVAVTSFFRKPDPDNPRRKNGLPIRLSIPLMIEPADESAATPKRAPALDRSESDDIAWGQPVAGLQVGARFSGKSREFAAGSEPQVQLLVRNVTNVQLDAEILMPHPADGWLLNVENERGGNVMLERSFLDIFAPEQSFRLTLKPGEAVPITGAKQQINGGSSAVENASFRIAREKPAGGFWRGGILISEGGNYNAVHSVWMKRLDIPGLRLRANAGELAFRVTGPGLTSDGQGSAALSDDVRNETDDASIKHWKARLIDGAFGKPLAGIKVQAKGAVGGKDETELTEFVSDDEGIFAVPVRDGEYATVSVLTPGWWEGGFQPVGNGRRSISKEDRKAAAPSPDRPVDIKLWPGQVVTGRLLYPDKSPAAGVLLNVGVYINNQEWKKRLGMDLNFYSFDHGEWPNWMRSVTTGDDGTFLTTVPPKEARWWVRVGTTGLGFGAIDPTRIDTEETGRALAKCVPFEVQIGGIAGIQPIRTKRSDALNFGDLQLQSGVKVRGRVVDADGNGLEGIPLTTTGLHGPHSGRSARSGKDGEFRLQPIAPGSLTIHPDARLRDEKGQVISRGVRAVFVDRSYEIPDRDQPVELVVKAVPHVELEFEWRDRRAKEAPVSYYGEFTVRGFYLADDGQRVHWHGETELIERDGRKLLVVKVPRALHEAQLLLPRDQVVTASYEDETGRKSGPGQVALGDITRPIRRTIFGDEPAKQ